jgi:hypothetical protein
VIYGAGALDFEEQFAAQRVQRTLSASEFRDGVFFARLIMIFAQGARIAAEADNPVEQGRWLGGAYALALEALENGANPRDLKALLAKAVPKEST